MSKKLWVENITNPAVAYQEVSPGAGYTDETNNMFAWDNYGHFVMDYYRWRIELSKAFYLVAGSNLENWATMTLAQKEIGCQYILVPYALRVPAVVTDQEDIVNWNEMVALSEGRPTEYLQGRILVVEQMRMTTSEWARTELLTMPQVQQFFKDVFDFTAWFSESNAPDLIQWISNTPGSPYENNGFAQQGYYSVALRDALIDVYNNPQ
jgi:hypothetical protein